MRPTIDIICDVTDEKPVTLDECKMALAALSAMHGLVERELRRLSDAVILGQPSAEFRALSSRDLLARMFEARKKDPLLWLGPENTPGTPEHDAKQRLANDIFKKATGLDLGDPRRFEEQAKARD